MVLCFAQIVEQNSRRITDFARIAGLAYRMHIWKAQGRCRRI
ncbi:hypothetical protein DSOL_2417 [Desulfosporosinus metallidurans]|uniref:Uncharacterized protein n=1 Tax=Desulfosporosinus metallidurans TaxID=1888891 RepID=A0A1Q8QWL3_9FIRM|nr:hypothetical protein DSOL_2417 [Desulfosporosinus metallidurans]